MVTLLKKLLSPSVIVLALGDSAAPMMLEKMANLEVLEIVATLDFAHRRNESGYLHGWS